MPKPDPILIRRSAFRIAHPAQSEIQAQGPYVNEYQQEMLKENDPSELHILRTYLKFLEAYLTSDGKFNIHAYYMENLKIQGFEQTLIQQGGGLEV